MTGFGGDTACTAGAGVGAADEAAVSRADKRSKHGDGKVDDFVHMSTILRVLSCEGGQQGPKWVQSGMSSRMALRWAWVDRLCRLTLPSAQTPPRPSSHIPFTQLSTTPSIFNNSPSRPATPLFARAIASNTYNEEIRLVDFLASDLLRRKKVDTNSVSVDGSSFFDC